MKNWRKNIDVTDCGIKAGEKCDYPDMAEKVCGLITSGKAEKGILVCGTGIGMSIADCHLNEEKVQKIILLESKPSLQGIRRNYKQQFRWKTRRKQACHLRKYHK